MRLFTLPNGPLEENCYLLGLPGQAQGILIDPGSSPDRLRAACGRHGIRPALILATHAHFDHVGAVQDLAEAWGAPFALHGADAPLLDSIGDMAAFHGLGGARNPRASRLLKDGETVEAAGLALKVLHTPGHTPGGCCFYHAESASLFSGDTLFARSVGRSDFEGGDAAALLAGIKAKLFPLPDATRVYPGHGPATSIGEERRGNPFLR